MTERRRYLGDEGEHIFASWCAREGLLAQKVSSDASGWDFLVQEPARIDLVRMPLTVLVQVKTTLSRHRYVDGVSLNNWNALARSPLPTFFLVLHAERTEVDRAALVHMDERRIAKVLMRIRKLRSEGKTGVGDRKMRLRWSSDEELSPPLSRSFRDTLEAVVADPAEYANTKQQWLRTVGYEDGHHRISFSASGTDEVTPQRLLAEVVVGLRDSLPVANWSFKELRFGIESDSPLQPDAGGSSAVVTIRQSRPLGVRLLIQPVDGSIPQVFVPAKLWSSRALGDLLEPKDHLERIRASHFSVVLGATTATFDTHFDDGPLTAAEIESVGVGASLFSTLHSRPVRITCCLEEDREVFVVEGCVQSPVDASYEHGISRLADLMENTLRVMHAFGVPSHAQIDFEELAFRSQSLVATGNLLLKPRQTGPSFQVCIEGADSEAEVRKATVGIPFLTHLALGGYQLAGMFVLSGRPVSVEPVHGAYEVEVQDARVDLAFSKVWAKGEEVSVLSFVERIEDWMKQREMMAVIPVEYSAMLEGSSEGA